MIKRISTAAVAAAAVACLAAPSGASATPVPQCVQTLVANAPGFVLNIVETGDVPRLTGPFTPC